MLSVNKEEGRALLMSRLDSRRLDIRVVDEDGDCNWLFVSEGTSAEPSAPCAGPAASHL